MTKAQIIHMIAELEQRISFENECTIELLGPKNNISYQGKVYFEFDEDDNLIAIYSRG